MLRQLFERFDSDHTGTVNFKEFANGKKTQNNRHNYKIKRQMQKENKICFILKEQKHLNKIGRWLARVRGRNLAASG